MGERRTAERSAVVSAGETTFIEFKLHGLGTVEGTVENEYTDAVLKGVRVTLLDQKGREVAESTTGDDGFYRFHNVRVGMYTVRVSLPKGYRSNDQTEKTVQVGTGASIRSNFLIHRHGAIEGRVVDETSDEPLAQVEVELVDSSGGVVRTVTTDAEGHYAFGELEVDRYTVRLAVPDHFEPVPGSTQLPGETAEAES